MIGTVELTANRDTQSRKIIPILDHGNLLNGAFFLSDMPQKEEVSFTKVLVPTSPIERRKFVREWAKKNARRIAEGFGAMVLLLPLSQAALAQEASVAADTIEGVVEVALQDNGDAILMLANGKQLRIDAQNVDVAADGTVLISAGTAEAVALAVAESAAGAEFSSLGAIGAGVAGLAVAAGGGGGGGGGSTPPAVELAYVVDGYISGATVFGDANGNAVLDAGEVQTLTAADGSFNNALFADDVPLVSIGGIDISTGEEFTGTLKAPAGSGVITPLTTLVQALVENSADSETPLTAAEAASQVANSLGLTEGNADILNSDPVALAEAGDISQLQAAAKIAAVINLVSAAAPGNPDAVDAVLKSLTVNLVDGEGADPFGDPEQIVAALDAAGEGAIEVNTGDLANAIVEVATLIDAVEGGALADLEQIQTAVQGELTQAVAESVGDTDGTTALNTTTVSDVVATTVPRPVITSATLDDDAISDGTEIAISGSGPNGATITVTLGAAVQTTVVDGSGSWAVIFAQDTDFVTGPDDEALSPVVTATIGENTSSAAINAPIYAFDVTPPATPTIVERGVNISDAESGSYEMAGNADAGSTVILSLNGSVVATVIAAEGGTWLANIPAVAGENTLSAVSEDAVGNRSEVAEISVFVDLTAPSIQPTTAPTSVNADTDDSVGFSGSVQGAESVSVEISQGGSLVLDSGTLTPAENGNWSTSFDFTGLGDGTYTATVIALDTSGNRSEVVLDPIVLDATPPAAPSQLLLNGAGADAVVNITEESSATLSGTAVAGATVTIAVAGSTVGTAVADAQGVFTFALDGFLSDGDNAITVTQPDAAGNVSQAGELTVSADLTAPSSVQIDTIAGDDVIGNGETGEVIFTGTGTNGDTVALLVGSNPIGTAVVTDGTWAITANIAGVNGDFVATANVTDAAGNPGTQVTRNFSVAVTDPVVTVNALPIGDVANASELLSALTVTGTFANATSVSVQLLNGTTPVGDPVTATLDGTNWSATITDISTLADGAYTVQVTASDGLSTDVQTIGFSVDATAPDAPNIAAVSVDNLVGLGDLTDGKYTLTGTTEAGSTVDLTIGGTTEAATVVGTSWTYEVTAVDAATDAVSVIATDAAGNPSSPQTTTITIDLSVPDAPVFAAETGTINGDGIASVVISGTAEANTTVTLSSTLFAADIEVLVGGDGSWNTAALDLSGNEDGDYSITAISTDDAGNTSGTGSATRTVDVVPNPSVTITILGDAPGEFQTEGDLVVYENAEFISPTQLAEPVSVDGNVQGVVAGTTVSVSLTDAAGAPLLGPYEGITDANGDFSITITEADIVSLDGMTVAGTVTITAGTGSFELALLVNSQIGAENSTVFLAGNTAVDPLADIATQVGGSNAFYTLVDGGLLSNGLTVAVVEVDDPDDLNFDNYKTIIVYDGQNPAPAELFAFDGGDAADVPARSTQIAVRDNAVLISQANATIDTSGTDPVILQGDPLYTLYTIPEGTLQAALPELGTAINFDTSVSGITETQISLADVGGASLEANEFYDLAIIPGVTGDPVVIMARMVDGQPISDARIVKIGADSNIDRPIAVSEVTSVGDLFNFDPQSLFEQIGVDENGEYTQIRLEVGVFEGLTSSVIYDFQAGSFTNETVGRDDATDLMIAQGGREILDGGDAVQGDDNDYILVGNAIGNEGALNIGATSASVDTSVLLEFAPDVTTLPLTIDIFTGGTAAISNIGNGIYSTASVVAQGTSAEGLTYYRVDVVLNMDAVRGASISPDTVDFFTFASSGVDGTTFYGLGISFPEDIALPGDPPVYDVPFFEGFQAIGGVDGEGRQTIILEDSQARGGFDVVAGFDASDSTLSNQDLLVIEADFNNYLGTSVDTVASGETLELTANSTGIVIFQGDYFLGDDQDLAVATLANDALFGLAQDQSVIALVAEGSYTTVWKLNYDGTNGFSTDSIGLLETVNAEELAAFTNDGFTNIELQLPTV